MQGHLALLVVVSSEIGGFFKKNIEFKLKKKEIFRALLKILNIVYILQTKLNENIIFQGRYNYPKIREKMSSPPELYA